MADIVFNCPQCTKSLSIDERGAGRKVKCVDCGKEVVVPASAQKTANDEAPGVSLKKCERCGMNYIGDKHRCAPVVAKRADPPTVHHHSLSMGNPAVRPEITPPPPSLSAGSRSHLQSASSSGHMVFARCPRCGRDDVYLICLNCSKSTQFTLEADGARCFCDTLAHQVPCPACQAVITKKFFFIDTQREQAGRPLMEVADTKAHLRGHSLTARCLMCKNTCQVTCPQCGRIDAWVVEGKKITCKCGHALKLITCPNPKCGLPIDRHTMMTEDGVTFKGWAAPQASSPGMWIGLLVGSVIAFAVGGPLLGGIGVGVALIWLAFTGVARRPQ